MSGQPNGNLYVVYVGAADDYTADPHKIALGDLGQLEWPKGQWFDLGQEPGASTSSTYSAPLRKPWGKLLNQDEINILLNQDEINILRVRAQLGEEGLYLKAGGCFIMQAGTPSESLVEDFVVGRLNGDY